MSLHAIIWCNWRKYIYEENTLIFQFISTDEYYRNVNAIKKLQKKKLLFQNHFLPEN